MATITINLPKHSNKFVTVTRISMTAPKSLGGPILVRAGESADVQTQEGTMLQIVEHAGAAPRHVGKERTVTAVVGGQDQAGEPYTEGGVVANGIANGIQSGLATAPEGSDGFGAPQPAKKTARRRK